MKKWLIATCACALALGATATDTKIATREWVIRQLATTGIRISSATTTENTNGTFTISVPFTSDTVTNCVEIFLTFTEPAIVPSTPVVRGLRLRSSAADENKLQIMLTTGGWKDSAGNEYVFDFGYDGYPLTWPEELPEVPSSEHVCELDANCYCTGYQKKLTYPDDYPEEYLLKTMDDFDNASFGDIISWIDTGAWPDQTTAAGKTRYWITDANYNRFNLEQIGKTDLWRDAVAKVQEKINTRLRECCNAYHDSAICDKSNPQHDWQTEQCGGNTWSVCAHNPAHKQGTEAHTGHTITETCLCGAKPSPHSIVKGPKVAKPGNTGWTQTSYCSRGCGLPCPTTDHTCVHAYCCVCEGGDNCDWPCPTCGGGHDFDGGDDVSCSRCRCPDCGVVESLTINGGAPVSTRSGHGGWWRCGDEKEPGNDYPGASKHCCCACRYNSCQGSRGFWNDKYAVWFNRSAESVHERKDRDKPTFERTGDDDDDEFHFRSDKSDCTYCGAPWRTKERHTYDESEPYYEYLSNEKCAVCKSCDNCTYVRKEKEDEAGPHVPDGEPFDFDDIGEHCRWWYHCSHCDMDYHEDDHEHQPPQTPDKWENVSDSICRSIGQCENCRHRIEEDHSHIRDTANHCLCANGCGFQFDHQWGGWMETERNAGLIHYARACELCGDVDEKLGFDVLDAHCDPTNEFHVSLKELGGQECGCLCGYYSPSNHVAESYRYHYVTDSTINCLCLCGHWHQHVDPTAYDLNSGRKCDSICAGCDERPREDGLNVRPAPPEKHTPASHRCGCCCRTVKPNDTNLKTFHPRKPGTCMCYGEDGNGGVYHYRFPDSDCPDVCYYNHSHKVAPQDCTYGVVPASKENHSPGSWSHCGCKCGDYQGSDYPMDSVPEWRSYHAARNQSDRCVCACGLYHLDASPRSDCTKICSRCGDGKSYLANDLTPYVNATQNDHTFGNYCECGCGKFDRPHNWSSPKRSELPITTNVCEICNKDIEIKPMKVECKRSCHRDREKERIDFNEENGHGDHGGEGLSNICAIHKCKLVEGFCPIPGCTNSSNPSASDSGNEPVESGGSGDLGDLF